MLKESLKYSFWINISQLISLVTSVIFAGMSLRYLGIFNTGVLISATTITSLSPLFGIGSFNESLIILFVKLKNFNKLKLFKKFFNGYLTFNLFVGILLATITMLIFPLIMKWSNIDVIESAQYFPVFIILLLAFCIDQLSNSFKILYEIHLQYEYLAVRLKLSFRDVLSCKLET